MVCGGVNTAGQNEMPIGFLAVNTYFYCFVQDGRGFDKIKPEESVKI